MIAKPPRRTTARKPMVNQTLMSDPPHVAGPQHPEPDRRERSDEEHGSQHRQMRRMYAIPHGSEDVDREEEATQERESACAGRKANDEPEEDQDETGE